MIETETIQKILADSKDYVEERIELGKLELAEKASKGGSKVISALIIFSIMLLFVICLTLYVGFFLSEQYNSQATGFGLVAGFYFIVLLLSLIFKKTLIEKAAQNSIIRGLFNDE